MTNAKALRLRSLLTGLTALVVVGFATLAVTGPAHAHDELVDTAPVADSAVESLPDEITLTFSGILSTEPGATEIAVTDGAGTSLVDGDPEVADTTVTQALTGDATGPIQVQWRTVSSDGHPVSGEYGFTVSAPTPTSTPTPTASSANPTPTASATAVASPTPTESPDSDAAVSPAVPWIIGGIVVVAVLAAVLYLVLSRRRPNGPAQGGSAGTTPDSAPPSER